MARPVVWWMSASLDQDGGPDIPYLTCQRECALYPYCTHSGDSQSRLFGWAEAGD